MSLNELTKLFRVQGKTCEYKQIWNTLDFFDDPVEFEMFKENGWHRSIMHENFSILIFPYLRNIYRYQNIQNISKTF